MRVAMPRNCLNVTRISVPFGSGAREPDLYARLRALMNMGAELLAIAAEREARHIDEKLFLEAFAQPPPEKAAAGGRRR
jgi:hypothetical protein